MFALRWELESMLTLLQKAGHESIQNHPSKYTSVSSLVSDLMKRISGRGNGNVSNETRATNSSQFVRNISGDSKEHCEEKVNSKITVTFFRPDGSRVTVKAAQKKTLYDAVIDNNVDIDGFGACAGTLCCTTCHLIFKQIDYEKLGQPREEELDMLDLAYGLTNTSRLGCQVVLEKNLDPLEVHVPASINDVRES